MPRSKKPTKKSPPKQPVSPSPAAVAVTSQERQPATSERPLLAQAAAPVAGKALASSAAGRIARRRFARFTIPAAVLLLALTGSGLWYFVLKTPDVTGENQQLIRQVSTLAVVPMDEVPAVTTVVDTTKVNQEFLRSARKGDKVLLYFQEGRAVVYRPSTRQIVNMGPLETPKPRVFLRDGTGSSNLDEVADKVTATNEFLPASRDVSPVKQYAKTVVVDISGNRPDVALRLARLINASVVQLPAGESKPDGDMLVIVGRDRAGGPAASMPAVDAAPAAPQP